MGNALAVRAAIAVGWIPARGASIALEGTAQNRQGSAAGIAVEGKKLLIERHQLRRWPIHRSGHGIHAAARQLPENVSLKRRRRHGGGIHDWQRDANPFGIDEEEQLVVHDGASQTASEVVHRRAGLVVSGG